MAAIEFTRVSNGRSGLVGSFLANTIGAFVAWNDARTTRNALSQLTDRELEDIGMIRGDIELVANGR